MRVNPSRTRLLKNKLISNLFGGFAGLFFSLTVLACAQTAPDPADKFHSALMDYFRVSDQQITNTRTSGVTDEELAAAFFIAQRAGLGSEAVIGLHASGLSWMQVAFHYRLNPWIFYTFLPGNPHGPYQAAYDKFNKPTFKINLTDADIVNLANLKFLSEYYGREPKEIIQKKDSGKTFRQINEDYWNQKSTHDYGWDVVDPNATPTPSKDFFQKVSGF